MKSEGLVYSRHMANSKRMDEGYEGWINEWMDGLVGGWINA